MLSDSDLAKYLNLLKKDPSSKIFAIIVDALRERGNFQKALEIGTSGVQKNPHYTGGHIALGRVYLALTQPTLALKHFIEATKQSPDNLLAYQLLGDTYALLKQSQNALKAYKMALLIDPKHEKSKYAIKKLETLSSSEYEEEVFQMKPIQKFTPTSPSSSPPSPSTSSSSFSTTHFSKENFDFTLDREISYLDALIARGEIEKAKERFDQVIKLFPGEPQLLQRMKWLIPQEIPTPIRPLPQREKEILERKRKLLESLLKLIIEKRYLILNQHLTIMK